MDYVSKYFELETKFTDESLFQILNMGIFTAIPNIQTQREINLCKLHYVKSTKCMWMLECVGKWY